MTSTRLTKVQQDVMDRMNAGWELTGWGSYDLRKQGEPSRHVAKVTVDSLWLRKIIKVVTPGKWVLA